MSESFLLYTSDYRLIEGLTDKQLGQLLRALFLFAEDGRETGLDPVVKIAFVFIADKIKRNSDKYQKKCDKLRANVRKRWRDGQDTNVYNCIQTNTKDTNVYNCSLSDSDSDSDSDIDNTCNKLQVSPKNEFLEPEEPSGDKIIDKKTRKTHPDYERIKDYWNERHDETNSGMSRITMMSERRETMIRARLRQVKGDMSVLYKAIDNAMASDFLNGNNGRGWVATFDWIFGNGNNFVKVLDGYTNAPAKKPGAQNADPEEPSLGEIYKKAKQPQPEKDKDAEQAARYQGLIDLLERDPGSHCRGALVSAYESGTLKRLGISWEPG